MSIEKTQMQLHTVRIIFFYFQLFELYGNITSFVWLVQISRSERKAYLIEQMVKG